MSHNNNNQFEAAQPTIQDARMRPNLGMQLPQFGFGNQGGIQGALQPLRGYISQQLQQKTNEEIGPFIEEVAGNAQETFDIESGGGYNNMLYGGLQPMPYGGRMGGGIMSTMQNLFQPAVDENNYNRTLDMAQGGSVPRQAMIEEQPHMLAYINPEEEMMLRNMGGTGQPGPGGVPAYPPQKVNERDQMDRMEAVRNNLMDSTTQQGNNDDAERRARIEAYQNTDTNTLDLTATNAVNLAKEKAIKQARKKTQERARQVAFMDNPFFYKGDKRLFNDGSFAEAGSRAKYGNRLRDKGELQTFKGITRPEPKTRAAQDAFIAAKQRSNFFQNNPEASGFENEGFIERGVKGSIPYQIFNNLFNNRNIMKDKLAKQGNYPIRGIGSFMDKMFNTTPVKYEPIFDKNNKLIGTVGINEKGTKTAIQGRSIGFDAYGKPVDYSDVNANTSDDGPDDTAVSPTAPVTCPDGYVFDSETNACVAIEGTAAATVVEEEPIVVDPNVSVETEYPLFNQGGGVGSLNEVARNMSRGPRGIAGYQGFMR